LQLGLDTLGEDFKDTLFSKIWDMPICSIFTSKEDKEFYGQCDADVIGSNAKCSSASFCDGLTDEQKKGTETVIATQIARAVFGFVDGPAGVIAQRDSMTEVSLSSFVVTG
jgi:hypothetical protein